MDLHIFNLEVIKKLEESYLVKISNDHSATIIKFNFKKRKLDILGENDLAIFLKRNAYQMNKILRNKREDSFYKGFQLRIVLRNGKDVAAFNDKSKIIVLDQLTDKRKSYVVAEGKNNIIEVFTDGSFKEKLDSSGLAFIIKDKNNNYRLFKKKSELKSSSLIELEAAIEALKQLSEEKYIRIVTDSQYVRKGLTEWIVNWELNGWQTTNGSQVKNKKYWLIFDKLTKGKYIEFKWVKAHSNQFENTLADLFAEEIAVD